MNNTWLLALALSTFSASALAQDVAPATPTPAPAPAEQQPPTIGATAAPPEGGPPAVSAPPALGYPPPRGGYPPGAYAPNGYPPPQPGPPLRSQREVRLASPRLHAIEPRRAPRRYGDAGAPYAFGIGAGIVWRDDRGYDLFTKHARNTGIELSGSYDVWATRSLVVAAGASYRNELHQDLERFDLAHNSLTADLTARARAASWLFPHVRLAAGFISTRFRADDALADLDYDDRDVGFLGSAGAGFTLRTPSRTFETHGGRISSLSLGVLLEGGYAFANDATLRAKPSASSDIERYTFSLGTLERGGPYLRVMFVVRF